MLKLRQKVWNTFLAYAMVVAPLHMLAASVTADPAAPGTLPDPAAPDAPPMPPADPGSFLFDDVVEDSLPDSLSVERLTERYVDMQTMFQRLIFDDGQPAPGAYIASGDPRDTGGSFFIEHPSGQGGAATVLMNQMPIEINDFSDNPDAPDELVSAFAINGWAYPADPFADPVEVPLEAIGIVLDRGTGAGPERFLLPMNVAPFDATNPVFDTSAGFAAPPKPFDRCDAYNGLRGWLIPDATTGELLCSPFLMLDECQLSAYDRALAEQWECELDAMLFLGAEFTVCLVAALLGGIKTIPLYLLCFAAGFTYTLILASRCKANFGSCLDDIVNNRLNRLTNGDCACP